jgi:hypothetical protein
LPVCGFYYSLCQWNFFGKSPPRCPSKTEPVTL